MKEAFGQKNVLRRLVYKQQPFSSTKVRIFRFANLKNITRLALRVPPLRATAQSGLRMKKGRRGAGYLVDPQEGETQLDGIVSTTKEHFGVVRLPAGQGRSIRRISLLPPGVKANLVPKSNQ